MATIEESKTLIISVLKNLSADDTTKSIKNALCALGHELKYKVCSSGCTGADEGEWLYDMEWYTEDSSKSCSFTSQPMVLECEWRPDPVVDGDFLKLVQARADIRVWIFAGVNVGDYVQRCCEQARLFSGSRPGDLYIFAGFDWSTSAFRISEFTLS